MTAPRHSVSTDACAASLTPLPHTTQSEANHDRLLSLMFTINLLTPCESWISTGLEGPYVFRDTPIRPLSIAFEQDMRAFLKHERYELSLTCADAECWEAASCNRHRFMVTHKLEWTSDNRSPFCLGLPGVTHGQHSTEFSERETEVGSSFRQLSLN